MKHLWRGKELYPGRFKLWGPVTSEAHFMLVLTPENRDAPCPV